MPTHWHGIIWREGGLDLSGFMRDFKRFTSVQLRKKLAQRNQESEFIISKSSDGHIRYRIWKERFDVVSITSDHILQVKATYIHNNPVKAGLVETPEEWLYSSAGFYYQERDTGVPVRWL